MVRRSAPGGRCKTGQGTAAKGDRAARAEAGFEPADNGFADQGAAHGSIATAGAYDDTRRPRVARSRTGDRGRPRAGKSARVLATASPADQGGNRRHDRGGVRELIERPPIKPSFDPVREQQTMLGPQIPLSDRLPSSSEGSGTSESSRRSSSHEAIRSGRQVRGQGRSGKAGPGRRVLPADTRGRVGGTIRQR